MAEAAEEATAVEVVAEGTANSLFRRLRNTAQKWSMNIGINAAVCVQGVIARLKQSGVPMYEVCFS
jgi:hypothetical protein